MIIRGVPNFFRAFFYSLMFRHNGVMRRTSAYLLRCIGDSIWTNCFLRIFQEYNVWTIDIYHFTHLVSAAWTWSQTGKRVRTFCCHFEYIIRNFNGHIIIIQSSLFLFHDQPLIYELRFPDKTEFVTHYEPIRTETRLNQFIKNPR